MSGFMLQIHKKSFFQEEDYRFHELQLIFQKLSNSTQILYLSTPINPMSYNQQMESYQKPNQKKLRQAHKDKCARGVLSNISEEVRKKYYDFLTSRRSHKLFYQHWLPSINNFNRLIQGDPVLRMNWEYGIHQCTNTLPGKTGHDVLNMVDAACKTPPSFSNADLVGFPINAIFVQFMQNENGRSFFANEQVNHHLKDILDDYQQLLLSPNSLEFMNEQQPDGWFCQEARNQIDYDQYICFPEEQHYGFRNWNQWFLRSFKPGQRPIGHGSPIGSNKDNIIVNSCESKPLALPVQPRVDVKATDAFWLKDDVYSLSDMFGAKKYNKEHYAQHFAGGTVYQAFLSALFYHKWHAPVSGTIEDIYAIPGTYYLDQSQFIPYDEGSPNNSESFLSAVAARKVVVIKADNHSIGKVAIIYIGMAEVSSCVTTVNIGDRVQKGQEIGHFEFGGSSHAMIFEKKAKLIFNSQNFYHEGSNGDLDPIRQNLHSFLAEVKQ